MTATTGRPASEWLSLGEVADQLGITTRTVRNWIAAGRLVAHRAGPKLLRVRRDDLDAMVRIVPTVGTAGR